LALTLIFNLELDILKMYVHINSL